jgi:hypothetical protein
MSSGLEEPKRGRLQALRRTILEIIRTPRR